MATAPTIYQKRLATRRATADIERLGKQYQTGLLDVTQQQQNAFTQWQKEAASKMAPYEASVKQYTSVAFPAYQTQLQDYNQRIQQYEQQAAAYRDRLNAFQASLRDVEANPLQEIATGRPGGRLMYFDIGGRLLSNFQAEEAGYVIQGNKAYTERPVPTFTEQPPAAPSITMPAAPTPPGEPPNVGSLDVAPFAAKRGQLETTFKRELGERKSAKQNVVMRRMGRPMLQET